MQFRYSKQAYKILWFLLIVITWMLFVAEFSGGWTPLEIFFLSFGLLSFYTLIFLTILDIIEWRYPRR